MKILTERHVSDVVDEVFSISHSRRIHSCRSLGWAQGHCVFGEWRLDLGMYGVAGVHGGGQGG
jgi:hypothetical protein